MTKHKQNFSIHISKNSLKLPLFLPSFIVTVKKKTEEALTTRSEHEQTLFSSFNQSKQMKFLLTFSFLKRNPTAIRSDQKLFYGTERVGNKSRYLV